MCLSSSICETLSSKRMFVKVISCLQAVQARLPRMPAGQPGQGTPAAAALRLLEGQEKSAGELVRGAVSCIVRRSSIRQAALGLLTAGGFRSAAYLLAKARKRWGSGTQPL